MRPSGRAANELRSVSLELDVNKHAEGSCLVKFGDTHVLCTASIDERVPGWLRNQGKGWVTAEYGMLPRATGSRTDREAAKGKQTGRTQEIQRLIGRSLRSVTDLVGMGERQIKVDCDVLQADGGTRTASITGAYVALYRAFQKLVNQGLLPAVPMTDSVAAVSCGLYKGEAVLDLDYAEDSSAQADANFVLTGRGLVIEVQGTAEEAPFTRAQLNELLDLAEQGVSTLSTIQRQALGLAEQPSPLFCSGVPGMARTLDHGSTLIVASHNQGKVREIRDLLAPFGITVRSAGELNLPEPEETEDSFAGNAALKALAAAKAANLPALSDDSGMAVTALDGAPGIYSARWAGPGKDFQFAMQTVQDKLGDASDRSGAFICALCLAWPDGHTEIFEGRVDGTLVWPPRGDQGFGYDPMFQPEGHQRTFGEMPAEDKHAISHRARAFALLVEACF